MNRFLSFRKFSGGLVIGFSWKGFNRQPFIDVTVIAWHAFLTGDCREKTCTEGSNISKAQDLKRPNTGMQYSVPNNHTNYTMSIRATYTPGHYPSYPNLKLGSNFSQIGRGRNRTRDVYKKTYLKSANSKIRSAPGHLTVIQSANHCTTDYHDHHD